MRRERRRCIGTVSSEAFAESPIVTDSRDAQGMVLLAALAPRANALAHLDAREMADAGRTASHLGNPHVAGQEGHVTEVHRSALADLAHEYTVTTDGGDRARCTTASSSGCRTPRRRSLANCRTAGASVRFHGVERHRQ
jgi:hypothetical protein